jgi:hypothetical protein
MRSQSLRALVLTGLSAAAVAVVPATATAAPAGHENVGTMDLSAHVNSNVLETKLYSSPYGTTFHRCRPSCANFYYSEIGNGRYHHTGEDGWVSTDKAGPGWC